jgi:hypothetical protein
LQELIAIELESSHVLGYLAGDLIELGEKRQLTLPERVEY